MAEFIGNAKCPLCANTKARVSLSKQNLAVLTCNGCNCQLFARSDRSDELVRKLLAGASSPAPAPAANDDAAKPPKEKPAAQAKPAAAKSDDWGI